ncbi:unnamed protein product [Leuciscus chuanchicus]
MCDAPARAFIKGIKSHTGYYGCDKCQQKGSYVKHRMTFPENDASCRTDEAFRLGLDEEHHLTHCPLLETDIDMVTGFPHDYMHLVCLGVVRRLTDLWCGAVGPLRTRLSSIQVLETYEEARQKLPEAEINTDLTDVDSPPVRRKRHIKRARFFDDSETEDEANFPLPAAPEVQINRIRKCTSRAGNYSQPLAREDAETMNSSSHTGFSEAWIRKILANQEMIKEQMGTLVKLVYDLKKLSTTEDSPTLNTDCFPLSSFQQLQVIEGQLQQEDYKTAVVLYDYSYLL